LAASQSEFESYKVRVHSVLKQQKAKSGCKQEAEWGETDRQKYQASIGQLKKELNEANESLVAAVSEREEVEEELERLSVRHDKLIQDSSTKEAQWKERVEEVQAAAAAKEQSYQDNIKTLTQENESLATSFKEQLKSLQQDHRHTVEVLQQQVAALEEQQNLLKGDIRKSPEYRPGDITTRDTPLTLLTEKQRHLPLESDVFKERQQAEGMDQLELESLALTTPGSDTLESPASGLERLLSGLDGGVLSSSRLDDTLKQQLKSSLKQIEHLTGVLHETEANSLRLTEQAKVLKDEIRRLERNQARDEGLSNLEYLKNVVLKFLQTKGSEQEHLIPVMTTLLKLSPQEIQMVTQAVKGDDSESTTTQQSGWSTYVHRWTGF
jgi:septal ring factor EnvC (AmiA/AmiB activator)